MTLSILSVLKKFYSPRFFAYIFYSPYLVLRESITCQVHNTRHQMSSKVYNILYQFLCLLTIFLIVLILGRFFVLTWAVFKNHFCSRLSFLSFNYEKHQPGPVHFFLSKFIRFKLKHIWFNFSKASKYQGSRKQILNAWYESKCQTRYSHGLMCTLRFV